MADMKEGMWCHVEIPAADAKKAQRFYGEVFGWKFTEIPEMSYTLYETGEGGIGGGFWNPTAGMPKQILNYILVNEIEPVLARIARNGGKQVKEKTEVPGAGWFALASDPDGNVIGLWKSNEQKKK
jgi:predicted enzyme related to lactoylglutathione lyase